MKNALLPFCVLLLALSFQATASQFGTNEVMLPSATDVNSLQANLFKVLDYGYRSGTAPVEYLTNRGGYLLRLANGPVEVVCSESYAGKSYHCKFTGVRELAMATNQPNSVQVALTSLLSRIVMMQNSGPQTGNLPYVRVRQNGNTAVFWVEGSRNMSLECRTAGGYSGCMVLN